MVNLRIRLLSLTLLGSLQAQEPSPTSSADQPLQLPKLAWVDTKTVALAPTEWKRQEWSLAALGVASVGLAFALDRHVDDGHRREGFDNFSKKIETLGGVGGLALVGGLYGGGVLADQPELRAIGADAAMAILISRVAMDLPLKAITGRTRPIDGEGPHHFKLFGKGDSFPSGHATQAFAIASVVAAHTDKFWLQGGVYGLATLVGLARVQRREHWLSDVVAGGLIGTAVGRIVVRTNNRLRSGTSEAVKITFLPAFGPDFRGLAVSARF